MPQRGSATYADALTYIPIVMTWGFCNEKKLIDLGNSVAWIATPMRLVSLEPC